MIGGVRKAVGKGLAIARHHPPGRDPRAGQPVRSQPRRRGRLAADPVRQDRPHAGGQHAGDDQPRLRPVRGQRHAGDLVGVPVAAVVLRPRRQAGRRLQVDLSLLLGARGHHRRLHRHVELGGDEQGRRRACGPTTATATRGATRSAASRPRSTKAGYKVDRSRPLSEPLRRLLARRSRPSRRRRSRSSPACRSRPTGRRSGSRPPSRASGPRWPASARRCCSRARWRRSATLGDGMSTEVWWTPQHPFKSSLTGATAAAFAADVHARDEEAVDAAARLHPRAVRGRPRRPQARHEPRRQGRDRRRHQGHQPRHDRRARSAGPRARCPNVDEDAAGRRPVGARQDEGPGSTSRS